MVDKHEVFKQIKELLSPIGDEEGVQILGTLLLATFVSQFEDDAFEKLSRFNWNLQREILKRNGEIE